MALQGVPWAIGAHVNGAPQTPAEAARALAYQALGGKEGPATPGDFGVVPLTTPGGGVLVRKGVLGVLNRFPGGFGQSYIVRNDGDAQVNITATGTGGGRTDLLALVVEDPQYPGQPIPTAANAANGPYVRFRVFEGVAATVKNLADVLPNQAGVALARITLPASTGTVQASHITDLRKMPSPRVETVKRTLDVGDKGTYDLVGGAAFEKFPQAASWTVEVPKWATVAQVELRVQGVRATNDATDAGDWRGKARLKIGTLTSAETILNPEIPNANKGNKFGYLATGEVAIPQAMRGTDQALEAQAYRVSYSSGVEVRETAGTTVVCEVRFMEKPNLDPPDTFY